MTTTNNLTSLSELITMLTSTGHPYLTSLINDGGTMINESIKVKLYPFKDMTRDESLRIDVHIIAQGERFKRSIKITPAAAGEPTLALQNHSGVSFDIPLKKLLEISSLVNSVTEKINRGESIATLMKPNLTITEFVNKYYRKKCEPKNQTEKGRLEKLLKYWGEYKVKNVYSLDIEKYKTEMQKKVAPITLSHYYILLKRIFKLALEYGFIDRDPFINVKTPSRKVRDERQPIPHDLAVELFAKMKDISMDLFRYCSIIYYTGMRSGDAVNITYENIKESNGIKYFEFQEGKNADKGYSKTIVPVHSDLYQYVLENEGTGYILKFNSSRSHFVSHMGDKFRKHITKDFTPYEFRHTFITELSMAGVMETYVRFLSGKLPEGTLKNYLKPNLETFNNEICKLPSVYSKLTRSEIEANSNEAEIAM